MRQLLSYEQLIAEKLARPPIPSLQDAIWANIEKGLDLDMPTGDGGGSAPSSPTNGGIGVGKLIGIIGVIISILYIVAKFTDNDRNRKRRRVEPAIERRVQDSTAVANPPPVRNQSPVSKPLVKDTTRLSNDSAVVNYDNITPLFVMPDSIIANPFSPPLRVDTLPTPNVPLPDKKKSRWLKTKETEYKLKPDRKDSI